jgi:hypothetical protein
MMAGKKKTLVAPVDATKKIKTRAKRGPRVAKEPKVEKPVVPAGPKEPVVVDLNPPKTDSKMYFNANTQAAIVEYQTCFDRKRQAALYGKVILPAYEKLVENLINIHKFTSLYDSYDDLKSDCVNFLFETIQKFDASRGSNAFSYFNVVAKNWLIIRTKQKITKTKRNVSLDDIEGLSYNEQRIIEEHCTIPSQDSVLENKNTARTITNLLYEIREKVKTENELLCINSIITIFENIEDIDLLNKSAVLLYMRELSGLSPKQLTMVMQSVKRHYRRMKLDTKFKLF